VSGRTERKHVQGVRGNETTTELRRRQGSTLYSPTSEAVDDLLTCSQLPVWGWCQLQHHRPQCVCTQPTGVGSKASKGATRHTHSPSASPPVPRASFGMNNDHIGYEVGIGGKCGWLIGDRSAATKLQRLVRIVRTCTMMESQRLGLARAREG
jgi:hypothetical protein